MKLQPRVYDFDVDRYPTMGLPEEEQLGLIAQELELRLYPSPTADFITIESKSLSDFEQITMYDMSGRLIWSQDGNTSIDNKITVDFTTQAAGNYIIRLADSEKDQSFSYSVVKTH